MSDENKPESVILSQGSASIGDATSTLSGTTATLTGTETLSGTQPGLENMTFITGADGQTYAVKDEGPFEWKKFFIGVGVPVLFVLAAWALMMMAENSDPYDTIEISTPMSKTSGTEYTGTISLDGHFTEEIESCGVHDLSSVDFHIECEEDWENDGHIFIKRDTDFGWERVGSVSTDGTVNYDDGENHGESFTIEFDFRDSAAEDTYNILWGISTLLCWLGPLSGIGVAIYGFAAGGKAMGIGALTSFVVIPAIFVVGCFALLFTGGF
jgi:hypothetical protein